jgi:SulP family sulfate permease
MTLLVLLGWSKFSTKIPSPLVALSVMSLFSYVINWLLPEWNIATIGSSFSYTIGSSTGHGIPQAPPLFALPWNLPGAQGQPFTLSLDVISALFPSAVAIAVLGAIESLLSAVVADGMAQTRHDPDAELIALGVGNLVCPFFGGIAATGAIARTATNIRYGARSPIAAIIHALFALMIVLLFAPLVSYLPLAALAALLLLVAVNMSEYRHFLHILNVGPRSDALVLILCCGLTIVFDMVIGVTVGVIFAALLFMRRMATITSGKRLEAHEIATLPEPLPQEIMLYEIAGPLFFGAAEKAMQAINHTTDKVHTVILVLSSVPMMDMTGLVALETTVKNQLRQKRRVLLAGVKHQPKELLHKSRLLNQGDVFLCHSVEEALEMAKFLENPEPEINIADLQTSHQAVTG